MPQVKSALMVSPSDLRVATTSGHVIRFKANKETIVPAIAVPECRKYGVKELKRFRGTDTKIPAAGYPGAVKSQVQAPAGDPDVPVTEADLEDYVGSASSSDPEPGSRNEATYTEQENRIRNGINAMLKSPDPDDYTGGKPKVSALNDHVEEMTVTVAARDRVWAKMEHYGEVPNDLESFLG